MSNDGTRRGVRQAAVQRRRRGRPVQPGRHRPRRSAPRPPRSASRAARSPCATPGPMPRRAPPGDLGAACPRTARSSTGSAVAARTAATASHAAARRSAVRPVPGREQRLHRQRHPAADLGLPHRPPTSSGPPWAGGEIRVSASAWTHRPGRHGRHPGQQIWDCNGGTNQQWTFNGDGTISNVRVRAVPGRQPRRHRQRHPLVLSGPATAAPTSAGPAPDRRSALLDARRRSVHRRP